MTQPVTLLVLGSKGFLIEACVLDVSSNGVQVRSPVPIAHNAQVKIEGEDVRLLGTVCHCEAKEGAYRIGIQLSEPMPSLIELELLNRALMGPEQVVKVESPSPPVEEERPSSKSK